MEVHAEHISRLSGSLLVVLALVLAACGGRAGSATPGRSREAASRQRASGATGEVVEIRWFCCLGTGDNAETQVPTEEAVVAAFNEEHDDIELMLRDGRLRRGIRCAGRPRSRVANPPDILGPAGVTGAAAFEGEWLDLTDVIESIGPRPDAVRARVRSSSTRSRGRARSACRSPPSPRCCTTTAPCSTRPASSTRRRHTVSRMSSTARRSSGTSTRSGSSPSG